MKSISEIIGISEPALYRHFKNKQAILCGLLDIFKEESQRLIDELETLDVTPLDRIEYFIMNRYDYCTKNPKHAKLLFSEEIFLSMDELAERMLTLMHDHKESISKALHESIKAGAIRNDIPFDALFRTIFGGVRLLIKQWFMSKETFDLKAEGQRLWASQKTLLC
jgi:AcrR family transcriptional regulator